MEGSRFRPLACRGSYFQLMDYSAITDEARCGLRHAADEGARRRVDPDVAVSLPPAGAAASFDSASRRRTKRSSARPSGFDMYNPALRFHIGAEHRMTVMKRVWRSLFVVAVGAACAVGGVSGQGDRLTADTFKDFEFRSIGPGLTSGRIADVAIDPKNPSVWYVAAGVGRSLENRESRQHLHADLRRLRLVFPRRRRRRSEETPTSSGSARARTTTSAASASATASTSRPTRARRGSGWGSRTPSTSRTS